MPARSLPERPHLDWLRREAKELRNAARSGDPAALERIQTKASDTDVLRLSTAQLVIAREYGFDSWHKLKAAVDALGPRMA